jgi:hypothetical protein
MSVPTQPIEGFHYDELSKIKVIDPLIAGETTELKEECKEFVDSKFSNNAHLQGFIFLFNFRNW